MFWGFFTSHRANLRFVLCRLHVSISAMLKFDLVVKPTRLLHHHSSSVAGGRYHPADCKASFLTGFVAYLAQ